MDLADVFRRYLIQIQQQLQELDAHIDFYNDLLQEQNSKMKLVSGYKAYQASALLWPVCFVSMIGNGENYGDGCIGSRDWYRSTVAEERIVCCISKRGDRIFVAYAWCAFSYYPGGHQMID